MRGLLLLCLFGTVLGNYSWNGPGQEVPTKPTSDNVCLTDTASCGCCLMQKQMHRMEGYFNMSLDELQRKVNRAQAALNNVRSSRSAFSVALTDTRRCVGPNRGGSPIVYEYVFLNLGDNYNRVDGVFTAPRAGVYSLALTVYSDSGAPGSLLMACANLRVNGADVAKLNDDNDEDQEDSATAVLALQLAAGDRVSVYLPAGCSLCDNASHYNTFSGFLLYATD
ncbi:cerebellin 20 [Anguilla anguilla]|uniref:cerebellin 20 n=1 Tax=Anguilla anguilla TaxID=7936 RepID=UPI0015AA3E43|nr:cerebellin 20 [Anguilla anguilla]